MISRYCHFWLHPSFTLSEARLCHRFQGSPSEAPADPQPKQVPSWMTQFFSPREKPDFDVESLENLTDDQQWLEALGMPGILSLPGSTPIARTETNINPLRFLKSVEPDIRQQMYVEFATRYIPLEIQEKHKWFDKTKPNERAVNLTANIDVVTEAIGGMMGIKDQKYFEDNGKFKELDVARDSLQFLYGTKGFPNLKGLLAEDYQEANEFSKLRHFPWAASDPALIASNLAPSRFKGALQLGVVDRTLLEAMQPTLKEVDFVADQNEGKTTKKLEQLTRSTDTKLRKEAESIGELWRSIPTWGQLAIVGTYLYGLFNFKTVRYGTLGVGAVWLVQKFALKQEDPTEVWAEWLGAGGKGLRGIGAKIAGKEVVPDAGIEDVSHRAKIYSRFMRKYDFENMETKATSLGLISDMSLKDIARNFTIDDGPQNHFSLNVKALDVPMQAAMEKRGWKNGYKTYFASSENLKDVSEAVGNILYFYAIQDARNDRDAELTEKVRGKLTPGTSLSVLHYPEADVDYAALSPEDKQERREARAAYIRLIRKGIGLWRNDSRPLGQSMAENLGFFSVPSIVSGGVDADAGGAAGQRRVVEGDDAERKTAEGGDTNRKSVDGGTPSKKTTDGGDASKKSAEGGDATSQKTEGGVSKRKATEGGDTSGSKKSADEGNNAGKKRAVGGSADVKKADNGGDANGMSVESDDSKKKTDDAGGTAKRKAME